ncbi:MAG: phosphotransferase family protein [Betaproteobacteria bacterium]|nr:phosphotransferase family protein [Betaproteobacteria bacterium]
MSSAPGARAGDVPPQADFDPAALQGYLLAAGLAPGGTVSVQRLRGGQSNPTYEVRSGETRWVLRKQPPGRLLPSAHAIDREFRVIGALHRQGLPVPEARLYCEDASVIGTPFYLMEFMDGRIFPDPALPELPRAQLGAIYGEMNRTIAMLHRFDYAAAGLADFGRAGNYFARQIARWTRQYRESATDPITSMDALIEWLPANIPPGEETSLVHGDFRIDNLVFDKQAPRVIGILDWELATLGHPLADFSYHCMTWHIPATLWRGLGGLDLAALGIPGEADYIAEYCRHTGRSRIDHWDFYIAYNLFRIAAILQGIARRARDGNASGADAVEMGQRARPLADLGWQMALRVRL